MTELLIHQIKYNVWATERLLNAGNQLTEAERTRDFGTADHSFQGTLTHIFRSERIWLHRLQHGSVGGPQKMAAEEDWSVLNESWPRLSAGWSDYISAIKDPDAIVLYRDLKDNGWAHPLWKLVMHVVNHATHHRGQAAGFLRAMGKTPPALDLVLFVRTQPQ